MNKIHLLLGLITLIGVVLVVWWEWNQRTSPGPLHPSHVLLTKLQGNDGCEACHGKHDTPMAGACEKCHQEIKVQRAQSNGLHGKIKAGSSENCASCHTDHTGTAVALVNNRSFQLAGIAELKAFDHSSIAKYLLQGRHIELECRQCHLQALSPALAEGQKRYLGLKQECVACHKDIHEGTYGPACESCHGQKMVFKAADGFVHIKEFQLVEAHSGKKCQDCHGKTGPTSVKVSFGTKPAIRTCVACHKDTHEGAYGQDCASCHGISKPFKVVPLFKHTEDFRLFASHADLACVKCHEKNGPNSVASLKTSNKSVRGCVECHPSPHRNAMVALIAGTMTGAKQDACTACHWVEQRSFLFPAVTITAKQHAATGFVLDKPHEKVECAACHKDIGKRKKLDPGPSQVTFFNANYPGRANDDCVKCHTDIHHGQFDKGSSHGQCVACHDRTAFRPNKYDLTMHKQAKYALEGAHQAVGCGSCHKKQNDVVQFIGTSTACVSCHDDVHRGKFEEPGRPAMVDGKTGCARCHSAVSFSEITWSAKEHDLWTNYKLVGQHAKASCADCHKRRLPGEGVIRTLGFAPNTCAECHTDVHARQFDRQNVTDCARCHSEADQFTRTTFDHQRDSDFKLDRQHDKLSCVACHRAVEIAPKMKVVRYRPLGKQCQDCHDPRILPRKEGT